MSVRVSLDPVSVAVVAGAEATVEARVHNAGQVVDALTVEVVGAPAAWATVDPPVLNLFPGADGTARITFRPPQRADVTAGSLPFGVRVTSREDPSGTVTEEGSVDLQPYVAVSLDLSPRTSKARRKTKHEIAVANHGNAPASVRLEASDPDQHLAFEIDPASAVVGPGEAVHATLRIRTATRHASGPPLTRPFEVAALSPDGPTYGVAQAMVVQEALRPPWLKRAVLWSLIGLVLLAAAWFALLKPTVESAAREAVAEEETPVTIGPGGGSGSGSGSGGGSGAATGSSNGDGDATATATPIDGRLFLTASGSTDFTVPDGKTLQLTDIVLQNPGGNSGTLRIQRGDTALLVVELANFRDLDYHFVAPIVFSEGQKLVLSVDCTSPTCTPGAYFAGYIVG